MNKPIIVVAIAAAFVALGIWGRREIRNGTNIELLYLDDTFRDGGFKRFLVGLSRFTQSTFYFAIALLVLPIGAYYIFLRG